MAQDLDLPKDWLNDHAKAFIPDGACWVPSELAVESPALELRRADEETLVAMKMAAERDVD